jgi:membrane protease YdiL (CAAX protease family)
MILCSVGIIIFYPINSYLGNSIPFLGYTIDKLILFVLFPIITVFYIERWNLKNIFKNLGVCKKNLWRSILYGSLAAVVTIIIAIMVSTTSNDLVNMTILFFEAFTEEFFFRGFFFLYLLKKTNLKIAYITSILGFVLMHPQHFTRLFLISTITQEF